MPPDDATLRQEGRQTARQAGRHPKASSPIPNPARLIAGASKHRRGRIKPRSCSCRRTHCARAPGYASAATSRSTAELMYLTMRTSSIQLLDTLCPQGPGSPAEAPVWWGIQAGTKTSMNLQAHQLLLTDSRGSGSCWGAFSVNLSGRKVLGRTQLRGLRCSAMGGNMTAVPLGSR